MPNNSAAANVEAAAFIELRIILNAPAKRTTVEL
jgi:hypothetical protein